MFQSFVDRLMGRKHIVDAHVGFVLDPPHEDGDGVPIPVIYGDLKRIHARKSDPITSHEAAEAVLPSIPWIKRRVLRYAGECGVRGFTDREMEIHFEEDNSSYRSRRNELAEDGMIVNSGTYRRADGDRCKRIVWMITRKGASVLDGDR